ncbi:hypothetical protein MTR67_009546 [Solanum verrucosum]|uniref:FAD-binding PCMH-type domain-containing protein n=1 Tax=Solanum verrucosum TaxID=315347 RepID=A0AAF0TEJ1_SOLVR|nr:hypothetical protein MTR67_009546 [Solanum verrucosum]
MLDLSNLNKIKIDLNEGTVWVQAGATLGQLYYAIAKKSNVHGFPGGVCFSIGTGGIISGGGIGTLMRKFGLAADNVVDVRGGGGASFGVILAWKLKLVRVPDKVTVFTVYKRLEGNQNLLKKWENIAHQLPDKLLIRVIIQNDGTDNEKYVEIIFQALRTNESLEVLLEKSIPTQKNYFKATSDFVKTPIPESGWEMVKRLFLEEERPQMILEPLGGILDKISESEIPFPHRKGNLYNIQYLVNWGDNSESISSQKITWMRKLYKKMEPYVAKSPRSAYLNYRDLDFGTNSEDYSYSKAKIWGEKYFKGNFERLAKVKSEVDPKNFFRNEQSIPPYHTDS